MSPYCSSPKEKENSRYEPGHGIVTTPLVIFTDANTFINPQAVREIVKCFNHPQVGCVAGEKRVDMYSTEGAVSGGEGLYWKYESWLKKMDYQLYSAIGAAGELFAIRTPLYEECLKIPYWMILCCPCVSP